MASTQFFFRLIVTASSDEIFYWVSLPAMRGKWAIFCVCVWILFRGRRACPWRSGSVCYLRVAGHGGTLAVWLCVLSPCGWTRRDPGPHLAARWGDVHLLAGARLDHHLCDRPTTPKLRQFSLHVILYNACIIYCIVRIQRSYCLQRLVNHEGYIRAKPIVFISTSQILNHY